MERKKRKKVNKGKKTQKQLRVSSKIQVEYSKLKKSILNIVKMKVKDTIQYLTQDFQGSSSSKICLMNQKKEMNLNNSMMMRKEI